MHCERLDHVDHGCGEAGRSTDEGRRAQADEHDRDEQDVLEPELGGARKRDRDECEQEEEERRAEELTAIGERIGHGSCIAEMT